MRLMPENSPVNFAFGSASDLKIYWAWLLCDDLSCDRKSRSMNESHASLEPAKEVKDTIASLPASSQQKILGGNAAEAYHLS